MCHSYEYTIKVKVSGCVIHNTLIAKISGCTQQKQESVDVSYTLTEISGCTITFISLGIVWDQTKEKQLSEPTGPNWTGGLMDRALGFLSHKVVNIS